LYRSLDEQQSCCGRVQKISPSSRFEPVTVQPVTSCYTDYAVPAHYYYYHYYYYYYYY
jgi:hypothetical protein